MEKARKFLKKVIAILNRPEMRILPGQLAFFLVISLIPLVALIGTIASAFSISVDSLKLSIDSSVPQAVADLFTKVVSGQGLNFNIVIFFISAFLLASNGPHSMIITSNEIYKFKDRDPISRRIKAILMIFILVGLFFFLLLVPVFGDYIFSLLKNSFSNQASADFFYQLYQLLKYPVILVIIYFNIKLIYVIAPDERIDSSTTTKGALFTTVGWALATEIYSFYIGTFSKYDLFYGSISNILILLLWVYILSYIFVLGMIINAGSYKGNTTAILKITEANLGTKQIK